MAVDRRRGKGTNRTNITQTSDTPSVRRSVRRGKRKVRTRRGATSRHARSECVMTSLRRPRARRKIHQHNADPSEYTNVSNVDELAIKIIRTGTRPCASALVLPFARVGIACRTGFARLKKKKSARK